MYIIFENKKSLATMVAHMLLAQSQISFFIYVLICTDMVMKTTMGKPKTIKFISVKELKAQHKTFLKVTWNSMFQPHG